MNNANAYTLPLWRDTKSFPRKTWEVIENAVCGIAPQTAFCIINSFEEIQDELGS